MLKYLIPQVALADLTPMLRAAFLGAIIAGVYGILHDNITYSISTEYFTHLKFKQFHYANFGFGDRAFVSCIGFIAAGCIGFIVTWFLARRLVPNQTRAIAYRAIFKAFSIVFVSAILAGVAGYLYGVYREPNLDYSAWLSMIRRFQIIDTSAFVRVAYIHNASYLGGLIGFIMSLVLVRPNKINISQH